MSVGCMYGSVYIEAVCIGLCGYVGVWVWVCRCVGMRAVCGCVYGSVYIEAVCIGLCGCVGMKVCGYVGVWVYRCVVM